MAAALGSLFGAGGGGFSSSSSATSGDVKSGDVGGGISSPVVIGGFKSDGTAAAFAIPQWAWIVGALVAGALAWKLLRK